MAILGGAADSKLLFLLFLCYCFCFYLGIPDAAALRVAAAMAKASLIDLLIAQVLSSSSSSAGVADSFLLHHHHLLLLFVCIGIWVYCCC